MTRTKLIQIEPQFKKSFIQFRKKKESKINNSNIFRITKNKTNF